MTEPTMPQVLDLDAYEDVDTAEVVIKVPGGGATPMRVTIAGPEHPDRKRLQMTRQRQLRAKIVKIGKMPLIDPEEDLADELEMLVVSTLGWTGASLPYSKDNARKLYSDPKRQWLRDQVWTALQDRELFTKACGQN